jgi:hypothetical protein
MRPSISTAILCLILSGVSQAQLINKLKLDSVGYKGVGCPQGSVQYTLSPDQGALSFIFDNYSLEVPAGGRSSLGCSLRFQMTPPYGYRLHVMSVDYRGFAALSSGARVRLNSEIRQQSQQGSTIIANTNYDVTGPSSNVFTVTSKTQSGPLTNCSGWPVIVNISSRFDVLNPSNDPAQMSVDSADLSMTPGTTLYLSWERCQELPKFSSDQAIYKHY